MNQLNELYHTVWLSMFKTIKTLQFSYNQTRQKIKNFKLIF